MMTLDEAIEHAEDKAKENGRNDCGKEHKQLAEWLKELKRYKESYDDTTVLAEITELNDDLNDYDWACVIHGEKAPNDSDYWNEYRTLSSEEFKEIKAGCCWDYCTYQADYFDKHFPDVDYSLYYIESDEFSEEDSSNHTWMCIFRNDKVYVFESSWKDIKGLRFFRTEDEMLEWYKENFFKNYSGDGYPAYVIYKYQKHEKDHLTPKEFVLHIYATGELVQYNPA